MKKFNVLFLVVIIAVGCIPKSKENKDSTLGTASTFAVVWEWEIEDIELVKINLSAAADELLDLWENGIVENVYFDAQPESNKLDNFPNISFFLKAKSEKKAKQILNKLTLVKKRISSYEMYPVGTLYLDRKASHGSVETGSKSFVSVWTNSVTRPSDNLIKQQSDTLINLWDKGIIENVYFDMKVMTKPNNAITDFVFFINAPSKKVADDICQSMPFSKEMIASYELYQAGTFWMGTK